VPAPATDRAALVELAAAAMARADGWDWAGANFSDLSTPATDRYRKCADAVLAVLPASTDRAAVLREAADGFDSHAEKLLSGTGDKAVFVAKALRDQAAVWREAAETLRRMGGEAPQPEARDEETALLRLTVDAAEEGRRELRSENARLRAQLWTLAAMLEGLGRLLATSSRDWGTYRVDAWLWAVLVGWDCEEAEHDDTCVHGAMEEMQQRHGWDDAAVAKARRYRALVRVITAPAATAHHFEDSCDSNTTPKADPKPETVHGCPPDGSGVTPCCGRTPFELPRTDRMTRDPNAVTCRTAPAVVAQHAPVQCAAAILRKPHGPHGWEPQPGMKSVRCPGACRCDHPDNEHSVYGCADGCPCEYLPARPAVVAQPDEEA
jgi:hypothetical protein